MIFETLVVGQLAVNCFILGCETTREAVVVDPGADAPRVLAAVKKLGLTVKYIINTHGHFDHIGGNRAVVAETGAPLLIHRDDVPLLSRAADVGTMYGLTVENSPAPAQLLQDAMTLSFGNYTLKVLHVPGHTPGGCCLYLESEKKVITGDTLFADSVGRSDLPGGSHDTLIGAIRAKLLTLPDDTAAYPGHGPGTTIGRERRHNEYLR